MKKLLSLDTGHKDINGNPIFLLDEVITGGQGVGSIEKAIIVKATRKGVRVTSKDSFIYWNGDDMGSVRPPEYIYVVGKFVPDIGLIHKIKDEDLKILLLQAS
jgi:hypothetical protein